MLTWHLIIGDYALSCGLYYKVLVLFFILDFLKIVSWITVSFVQCIKVLCNMKTAAFI